jgi:hypothetical protein
MIIYKQDFSVVTGKIKHEISSTATEGRSQQHRVSYIGRYCDGSRWRDWEGRRHDLGTSMRFGKGGASWWWRPCAGRLGIDTRWMVGRPLGGGVNGDRREGGCALGRAMGAAMRTIFSIRTRGGREERAGVERTLANN